MNPPEEQLTSQDILLLRSLLGRFGGQLAPGQATPSTLAPPGPPIQPSPSAIQPAKSLTQSIPPVPIPNIPNNGPGMQHLSATQPVQPVAGASLTQSQSILSSSKQWRTTASTLTLSISTTSWPSIYSSSHHTLSFCPSRCTGSSTTLNLNKNHQHNRKHWQWYY